MKVASFKLYYSAIEKDVIRICTEVFEALQDFLLSIVLDVGWITNAVYTILQVPMIYWQSIIFLSNFRVMLIVTL